MAHHHLGFHLLYGFKRNADQDDNRSTAHGKAVHTGSTAVDDREQRDESKEQSADEGNPRQDFSDKISRRLAGTDARDCAVVLTKIIGHFNRIILNGRIEIRKEDNQDEVKDGVKHSIISKQVEEASPEALCIRHKHLDCARDGKDGACKDDRQNTAETYLDGQVAALSAVHLSADNTLCVLYGDAALRIVHENDDPDDEKEQDDPQRYQEVKLHLAVGAERPILAELGNGNGHSCHDTGKQQDGNTVSNAILVDLLAEPHHQSRTGCKREDDNGCREYTFNTALVGHDVRRKQVVPVSAAL